FVAEVVRDQFEVLAVEVAAPDGAGPAVGAVAGPLLAVLVDEVRQPLIPAGEVELAVGPEQDAVHAVIVIDAAEARQQLAWGAVRLAVAVLVLEDEDIGRLAHVDRDPGSIGVRQYRDAERGERLG